MELGKPEARRLPYIARCKRDNEVTCVNVTMKSPEVWAMIVLALSASLIASVTMAAVSLLVNIEQDRKYTGARVF
jgi:hypothetical protein